MREDTCSDVELECTRERQNIDIHLQGKNITCDKILPSTSMAYFFCPRVIILIVPEDIHVQLSQARNFAERSQFHYRLPANVVQRGERALLDAAAAGARAPLPELLAPTAELAAPPELAAAAAAAACSSSFFCFLRSFFL